LRGHITVAAFEQDACGRAQSVAQVFIEFVLAQHEYRSLRFAVRSRCVRRTTQRSVQRIGIFLVGGIQKHEIGGQLTCTPVTLRIQQLVDEADLPGIFDACQHDRQVAGDALGPQHRRTALAPGQDRGVGTPPRITA
jgi:hypothetical protein